MDPVTVIVAALAAGVAAGGKDVMQRAVKDTYDALRSALVRIGRAAEVEALEKAPAADPEEIVAGTAAQDLRRGLESASYAEVKDIERTARDLQHVLDDQGSGAKWQVVYEKCRMVQTGDHNTMDVRYGRES